MRTCLLSENLVWHIIMRGIYVSNALALCDALFYRETRDIYRPECARDARFLLV